MRYSWWDDDAASPWFGDDGTKDAPPRIVALGVLVPLLFVVLAIVNIAAGQAYWPNLGRRGGPLIVAYDGIAAVTGTVMVEVGTAGLLVAWYGLANFDRTGRFCWPVIFASFGVAVAGFVVFLAGTFKW